MRGLLFVLFILILTSFYYQSSIHSDVVQSATSALEGSTAPYPQGYFAPPVGGKLELSGTFGELRKNHFHAGIDIAPTRSGSNEPIYAAADGYVAKIRTQEGGYGQSLYIAHPNGFTTVYAHMDGFTPEIMATLRQKQYENETFELEVILQPADLPIRKGQQVGIMGNRGASQGEHLHFEIRETQTDKAVNPLLFGFDVPDNVPPRLEDLKVYLIDDKKEVIGKRYYSTKRKSAGHYNLSQDTLDVAAPNVGFAIQATDIQSGNSGENGIFTLEMKANDSTVYKFKAEKVGFAETRSINAHIDYWEHFNRNYFYHRAFRLAGDLLPMYESLQNDGIVPLSIADSACKKITLIASDVAGNSSTVSFIVRPKKQTIVPTPKPYTYFLPFDKESIIKPDDMAYFYFPKGCFYENIYAQFGQAHTEGGQYSQTYQVHDVQIPIQNDFNIAIKPINLPDSLRSKAYISYCVRADGRTFTCGGTWDKDGYLTAKNNKFGNYAIEVDRVPPTISVENFAEKMTKRSRLEFKISDNIEGRPVHYRAELDGKWLLMEMDAKSDLLFCNFDKEPLITLGEHSLRVTVTDDCGNNRVFARKLEIVDHVDKPKPKPESKPKEHEKSKSKEHESPKSKKKK